MGVELWGGLHIRKLNMQQSFFLQCVTNQTTVVFLIADFNPAVLSEADSHELSHAARRKWICLVPCSFPSLLRGKTAFWGEWASKKGKKRETWKRQENHRERTQRKTELVRKTYAMFTSKVVHDLDSLTAKMKIKPLKMLLIKLCGSLCANR